MNAEVLRQMIRQRPFVPFEVRMSNGDIYQICYPDFAFVLRSNLVIGDPDADSLAVCALDQLATVNVAQQP